MDLSTKQYVQFIQVKFDHKIIKTHLRMDRWNSNNFNIKNTFVIIYPFHAR